MTDKPVVIALCGKSASGKDWYKRHLCREFGWHPIVSATTRPPREGEKNGVDYDFVSDKAFQELVDKDAMLEYATFRGWYYGTPLAAIDKDAVNVGVFNLDGISSLLEHKDKLDVRPIMLNAPLFTRLKRSIKREGKFKLEMLRRLWTDHKDFSQKQLSQFAALLDIHYEWLKESDVDATDEFIYTLCCGHLPENYTTSCG